MSQTFPYLGYKVQPSGKVVQLEVVGPGFHPNYVQVATGGSHLKADIFPSLREAADDGLRKAKKRQSDLDKKQKTLNTYTANLRKALKAGGA